MNSSPLKKILVVRTDRIGDVILTLPVVPRLRNAFPEAEIWFLARTYTRELVEHQPDVRGVLVTDGAGAARPFLTLVRELRGHRFDASFVVHPTFRLAALMIAARIPLRIGTGYRWYSALFSRRVREHRRTGIKHEAEYNVSLLRAVGVAEAPVSPPTLYPSAASLQRAESVWIQKGLDRASHVAVLHPGSGGSARDWRPERFGKLAALLEKAGVHVVLTGGPGEESIVQRTRESSGLDLTTLVGEFSLDEMSAFLQKADLFVSNSTGPLHIAAAVGTPVVAFYPPIPQCSARRWGPLTERKVLFEPKAADCPRCRGGPCQADDCMETIRVEEVLRAACMLLKISEPADHYPAAI